MLIVSYILLGLVVGFLGGLLGVGGGMTIVPTLLFIFTKKLGLPDDIAMHLAIGTSLATIILTAAFTTRAHHKKQAVLWPVFWSFAPGVTLGALLLGPILALFLSGHALRILFAIFCLLMASQIFFTLNTLKKMPETNLNFFKPGLVVGMLSAMLGIAGGSLAAVILHWYRYSMRNIVGTTAAIGLPVAVSGAIGFLVTGWHASGLPAWTTGYIYWPAFLGIMLGSLITSPLGAYCAHKLPVKMLKKCFGAFLLIVGLELISRH